MVFHFWKVWQFCPLVAKHSEICNWKLRFPRDSWHFFFWCFHVPSVKLFSQLLHDIAALTSIPVGNYQCAQDDWNFPLNSKNYPTHLMPVAELWIVGNIFFVIIGDGKHDQHIEQWWIPMNPVAGTKKHDLNPQEENETQQHPAIIRSWDPSPNAIVVVKTFLGFQFSLGKFAQPKKLLKCLVGGWHGVFLAKGKEVMRIASGKLGTSFPCKCFIPWRFYSCVYTSTNEIFAWI